MQGSMSRARGDERTWCVFGMDTLPRLFRHVVAERGDKVAMREKELRDLAGQHLAGVRRSGRSAWGWGWWRWGCEPRDVVSILADNSPEWLFTDLGVLCAAGVTTGIYPTDSPAQVEYIVNDSGTRFLFVENEEQLDKILEVRERMPRLVQDLRLSTWRGCAASPTRR